MHNEGKSTVAERLLEPAKNKINKHMTSISKNVYNDKLDDIVNKYNNTFHSTIKMKLADIKYIKASTYIDFNKENNKEDPKFKVVDHVRTSKYKNIFAKCYNPNWSDEVFVIKKVKYCAIGNMSLVI